MILPITIPQKNLFRQKNSLEKSFRANLQTTEKRAFDVWKRLGKKSGLYDKVVDILKGADKNVVELSGIKSNPSYSQLKRGSKTRPRE
ncbi:MAG: hypothetical protein L6V93_04280 [Clostridiales bacterium]|nr:MAG: hypothetical protein L6V93_04280 [Clostridiales bacterium]